MNKVLLIPAKCQINWKKILNIWIKKQQHLEDVTKKVIFNHKLEAAIFNMPQ